MSARLSLTVSLLAVMSVGVSSQVKSTEPLAPSSAAEVSLKKVQALIRGTAVDGSSAPLPNVTVRLRNLAANKIEQVVKSDQRGQFTFVVEPDIPYVVEIADRFGNIVAVGDVITTLPGDVAAAVVAIPARLPAMTGLFGETASSILTAVTVMGISVIDPDPPLSPEK